MKKLEKDGWRVLVEPRIPTADSFVKPDLVFWNTEKAAYFFGPRYQLERLC